MIKLTSEQNLINLAPIDWKVQIGKGILENVHSDSTPKQVF